MRSLVITAPAAQRAAINAELESRGYGPDNLSVALTNGQSTERDEDGNLTGTPTHYSCHWWATDAQYADILSLRDTALAGCAINGTTDLSNPTGLFGVTNGDFVQIRHKEFSPGQWGWRAEFVVQADEFEPGVRAIAIYADAEHQQYLYTTGAFTLDGDVWATEWNAGTAEPQDVHWALLWASAIEHSSTLAADADRDIGWLRQGVPGDAVPPPVGALPDRWNQPGAPAPGGGVYPAYAIDDLVVWDRPQDGGEDWVFRSKIANNTAEPSRDAKFDRWWEPVSRASEYQP